MRFKPIARRIIERLGLLSFAQRLKEFAVSLKFLPSNIACWKEQRGAKPPVPPLRLVVLVAGSPDVRWFVQGGRSGYDSIIDLLTRNNVDVGSLGSVLDFGCGCGRVTRHWDSIGPKVFGSDTNPALIDWCSRHLSFAHFDINLPVPPLKYPSVQFDLVYALSVLTHMPAETQQSWMGEFARVLKEDGCLVVTTHGSHYLPILTEEERHKFNQGEVVLRTLGEVGSNRYGAYQSEKNVRERLAKGFVVVDYLPKGAAGNPFQDLWLLKKQRSDSPQQVLVPLAAEAATGGF